MSEERLMSKKKPAFGYVFTIQNSIEKKLTTVLKRYILFYILMVVKTYTSI